MIDRMIDRCKRICGSTDRPCYINSREQINCIADMVINKTAGISMILELSLRELGRDIIEKNMRESITVSNELSNWIKYLQLVRDLQELSSLVLDADTGEKRLEIRYPLPEAFREDLATQVKFSGSCLPVSITNFSQSGLQFQCPKPLETGSLLEHMIASTHSERNQMAFAIKIKYCLRVKDCYLCGARLEKVQGGTTNFFNDVFSFINEARLR